MGPGSRTAPAQAPGNSPAVAEFDRGAAFAPADSAGVELGDSSGGSAQLYVEATYYDPLIRALALHALVG